jgi:hypothetical protein
MTETKSKKRLGGIARAESLTPEKRREIAQQAAVARWRIPKREEGTESDIVEVTGDLPVAIHRGLLPMLGVDIPCYVLTGGIRVIGRTSATEVLTGIKGGGGLEKYLGVVPLKPFINLDLVLERMVAFRLPEVEGLGTAVKGLPSDLFIEICQGFITALDAHYQPNSPHPKMSPRQIEMAMKASMFLSACAKVGLDALIDEITGYQYERTQDALEIKFKAYLSEEMRKWEKTFPDELWMEFGRLTGWKGNLSQRPKYWGKLVMELIYEHLDSDIAEWLRKNAPAPRHGQNYHQWLSGQYGLRKLVEHIWMVIGVAKTCENMLELRDRMAALDGKIPVQLRLYFPPPTVADKEPVD